MAIVCFAELYADERTATRCGFDISDLLRALLEPRTLGADSPGERLLIT